MDQLRGAINSFTSGNNQQNPQHSGQATSSGGGNVLSGMDNGQYPQQTGQGTYGGGLDNNGRTVQQMGQGTSGGGGNFLGGLGNKLNAAAGGGPESEKNEDMLDKGGLPQSRMTRRFCADKKLIQPSTMLKKSSSVKVLRTTSRPLNR